MFWRWVVRCYDLMSNPPLFELPEYEDVVDEARLLRSRKPVGAETRPASLAKTPRTE